MRGFLKVCECVEIFAVTVEGETHVVEDFGGALGVQVADVLVGRCLDWLLLGVFLGGRVCDKRLVDALSKANDRWIEAAVLLVARHGDAGRNLNRLGHL